MNRLLIIAGSDSGGGAGIQADIKTATCFGVFATTAITALTAQNTLGVQGIFDVPPAFIAQQIQSVLNDIGTDAIKTGMLHSAAVIETVVSALDAYQSQKISDISASEFARMENSSAVLHRKPMSLAKHKPEGRNDWLRRNWNGVGSSPMTAAEDVAQPNSRNLMELVLVVDPVMVAKGGAPLLQPDAIDTLKNLLLPRATLVTPNIPEAEILSGMKISTPQDMQTAGAKILALGCQAVLMKGGHLESETLVDYLITPLETHTFTAQKHHTRHTHGTGCTYAAAIAAGLAQNLTLTQAVTQAHQFVQNAIKNAPNLGQGQGPLGHTNPLTSCNFAAPHLPIRLNFLPRPRGLQKLRLHWLAGQKAFAFCLLAQSLA